MFAYAHWLLRLVLAGIFFYHGLSKFSMLNGFAAAVKIPVFLAFLVAVMETLGGFFVLAGGFLKGAVTRVGAALLVPVMVTAIFRVHWGLWSGMPSQAHPAGGMEFPVTLLALSLYFLIRGNRV
jgi:putative oxidoreductase